MQLKVLGMIKEFFVQKKLYEEINKRELIEKALKESEINYRELLDNIAHGVFRTTPEGKLTFVNKATVKLLGYSSEEEMYSLNVEKDIYLSSEQRKIHLNSLNKEDEHNSELDLKRKDGSVLTCLFNTRVIRDKEGKVLYYEGTITDITEYKKLKSHIDKLELAIRQSGEGVVLLDTDRNIEYINEAFAGMHGYVLNELYCKNISIFHPQTKAYKKDIEELTNRIERDGYFYGEVPHLKKDGSVFTVSLSVTIVKDYENRRIGQVGICKDLTEQKRAETEIRRLNKELEEKVFEQNKDLNETNLKLKQIIKQLEQKEKEIEKAKKLYITTINSSNEWIHYINRDYKFVLINDAFIKINKELGLNTDVIGKKLMDVYYFLPKNVLDEYEYVFKTGKELITEENNTIGGKIYNSETTKTPVFENEKVAAIITTIRDITGRKEMERKVLTAVVEAEEKDKKRFSEDLHDGLGALLSTMKIYVNSILKKQTIEESYDLLIQLKDMIFEAIENTRGISFNMTPNILIDYGLIRAIRTYCEKINNAHDINVTFNSNEYSKRLNQDIEINLFRILQELINNSLKHSGAKNINISFDFKDNGLNLLYSDDGKGFDKEKISDKNVNGIGMNNIFARVKLLNGICKIDSDKGKGTKVDIEINNLINS